MNIRNPSLPASTAAVTIALTAMLASLPSRAQSGAPLSDSTAARDSSFVVRDSSVVRDSAVGLEKVLVKGRRNALPKASEQVARIPLKNLENPQSYSVVTKETIEKRGITTFTDAVRTVPGVVAEGPKPGVRPWPMLRGFLDQAFFRNGKMLGSWTELDVANIERIDVLKGPSGTLFGGHGRSSYGGVINRVTKKPYEVFGGEAELISGNNGYNRATLDLNAPINEDRSLLTRIDGSYRKEDSYQDYGWGESYFLAPVLTYRVNDRFDLLLESEFFKFEGASSSIYPGAGVTNLDQLLGLHRESFLTDEIANKHQTVYFNADGVYKLGRGWTSTTSYAFSHSDYNYYSIYATPDLIRDSVDRQGGSYVYDIDFTDIQQNFNGDFMIGPVRNRVVLGLDYLRDDERYSGVSADLAPVPFGQLAPYVTRSYLDKLLADATPWGSGSLEQRYSGYGSDVISPLSQLHLMASMRYEYAVMESPSATEAGEYDDELRFEQGAWTPKFGAVYEILKERLSVFGNYMGGTRNIGKITIANGTPEGKEVKAKPERATQFEGGFKADLFEDRLSGTISCFDITVDNKVRPEPGSLLFSRQDGTEQHRGVEVELFASLVPGLDLSAGYAFLNAEFLNGTFEGKQVSLAPEHSVKYWAAYTFKDQVLNGLGLGIGGDYRSESYFDDDNTITIPDAHLINAVLSYNRPGYRLAFEVDNVNDDLLWGIGGEVLARRTFKGSISTKF
jgi:iron complex outermembrane receptor protein